MYEDSDNSDVEPKEKKSSIRTRSSRKPANKSVNYDGDESQLPDLDNVEEEDDDQSYEVRICAFPTWLTFSNIKLFIP